MRDWKRASLCWPVIVAIHASRPAERPRRYVALTTADTVVIPKGADAAAWAAANAVIRRPMPPHEGRFLHRDFQPRNVLFDVPPSQPAGARITGVVDWAATSWGPADLDVAHCSVNLALNDVLNRGQPAPSTLGHRSQAKGSGRSDGVEQGTCHPRKILSALESGWLPKIGKRGSGETPKPLPTSKNLVGTTGFEPATP